MALTADEQALFDHARASLPQWFWSDERANEELGQAAKVMGKSLLQARHWLKTQALIGTAAGATSAEPDWLEAHAVDHGTRRQNGETDTSLRYRLRHGPNSIIRQNLLTAIGEVLVGNGVAGDAFMVELPRDQIFVGQIQQYASIGGTLAGPDVGGVMTFLPDDPFQFPPWKPAVSPSLEVDSANTILSGRVRSHRLVLTGAAAPGNNGNFITTGIVGNAVKYVNPTGAAGIDAAIAWAIERRDRRDLVLDVHGHSFVSRGERIGRSRGGTIIVILPYGTDAGTGRAVTEMLRQKKGAGVILYVEIRANP